MNFSICPIGTNSAFTQRGFNSNYIVRSEAGSFLFDCGSTAGAALDRLGLSLVDVSEVYLSHLHLDHVGGLIQLGLTRFSQELPRPKLYCHRDLGAKLWPVFLRGLMGIVIDRQGNPKSSELEDFFEPVILPDTGGGFDSVTTIAGLECVLIKSKHPAMSECHGLIIDQRVFLTSDAVFQPNSLESVANHFPLEMIIHHCTYNPGLAGMHATVDQLRSLPEDLRELIMLSHYDDQMIGKSDPNFELAETGRIYEY